VYSDPVARLHAARADRNRTDYLFDFWTAFGWTILTCGFYSFYIYYRLMERMREHNRRRLAFLEAANEIAWRDANAQGRAEELRPQFERIGADLAVMRQMTADFRDPAIWLVIILLSSSIGLLIAYYFLDQDLVKHGAAETDATWQLQQVFEALGRLIPSPPPRQTKEPHNIAGRIIATIASCGLYSYWWLYDLMVEPNEHFRRDWAWEDAVVTAVA
jgi:hypothetical protein